MKKKYEKIIIEENNKLDRNIHKSNVFRLYYFVYIVQRFLYNTQWIHIFENKNYINEK